MTGTGSLLYSADPLPFASARPASNTRCFSESGFRSTLPSACSVGFADPIFGPRFEVPAGAGCDGSAMGRPVTNYSTLAADGRDQ